MHQRTPLATGIDTAIVVAFVSIGRRTHEEGSAIAAVFSTAAPFLIALAVGWLSTRAWTRPTETRTGVKLWAVTVVLGMLLRRFVFDDGTATPFVIVATIFLALLIGWRVAYRSLGSRRPVDVVDSL